MFLKRERSGDLYEISLGRWSFLNEQTECTFEISRHKNLNIFISKVTKMTDHFLEFPVPAQSFKNIYMSKEVKYLFEYFL